MKEIEPKLYRKPCFERYHLWPRQQSLWAGWWWCITALLPGHTMQKLREGLGIERVEIGSQDDYAGVVVKERAWYLLLNTRPMFSGRTTPPRAMAPVSGSLAPSESWKNTMAASK